MASRQEEKERRRAEREATERAERERAARTKRLRTGGGITLITVAIAAALFAVLFAGGSSGPKKPGRRPAATGAAIPAQRTTDLAQAAATARCTLRSYHWTEADRNHVPDGTKVKYRSNPPSYGDHYSSPASDGDYVGQGTPPAGNIVHALEHGRIELQYRAGLPRKDVAQLERFFQQDKADKYDAGQYVLLFQNATRMPYEVAATAWGHDIVCPKFNEGVFDAFRAFRVKYTLQAPEKQFLG